MNRSTKATSDGLTVERHAHVQSWDAPSMTAIAVIIGFITSLALASLVSIGEFVPSALFLWVPQVCVILMLRSLRARQSIVAGVGLLMAVYLGAFGVLLLLPSITPLAGTMYLVGLLIGTLSAAASEIWIRNHAAYGGRYPGLMPCMAMLTTLVLVTTATFFYSQGLQFGY